MDANGSEIDAPVLLDNTVLTNLALVDQTGLVELLWPGLVCTTPSVCDEYSVGAIDGQLPPHTWAELATITLTDEEIAFAESLPSRLGAGERTCLAVAVRRQGLFVSDDLDARQLAQALGIPLTGTIGILVLCVRRKLLSRDRANALLTELITLGYRSPLKSLDPILDN